MGDQFVSNDKPDPPTSEFVTTHWSVVLAAGQAHSIPVAEALEKLCRTYWHPLYFYIRRQGWTPADAEDLTQAFFARLLQRGVISRVDPNRGRFRSFLLASLKHFLADEKDRASAQKRGGGRQFLSFDTLEVEAAYLREPVDAMSPDKIYDRRWATTLMEQAMKRLRTEQQTGGTMAQFEILSTLLLAC